VTAADSKLLESGARVSGTLELEARASLPDGGTADRFELFVDGVRVAQTGLGERLSLDTSAMADLLEDDFGLAEKNTLYRCLVPAGRAQGRSVQVPRAALG
jgi:hypothetical protein